MAGTVGAEWPEVAHLIDEDATTMDCSESQEPPGTPMTRALNDFGHLSIDSPQMATVHKLRRPPSREGRRMEPYGASPRQLSLSLNRSMPTMNLYQPRDAHCLSPPVEPIEFPTPEPPPMAPPPSVVRSHSVAGDSPAQPRPSRRIFDTNWSPQMSPLINMPVLETSPIGLGIRHLGPASSPAPRGKGLTRSPTFPACEPPMQSAGATPEMSHQTSMCTSRDSLMSPEPFERPSILPVHKKAEDGSRHITAQTLEKIIAGEIPAVGGKYQVIDCRFPYEFDGGHIRNAINIHSLALLQERFMGNPHYDDTTYIFHCEFSSSRAPTLCRALHDWDSKRTWGMGDLLYPNLYVLHQGYSHFYLQCLTLCEPQGYIAQHHPDYDELNKKYTRERKMAQLNRRTADDTERQHRENQNLSLQRSKSACRIPFSSFAS